MVVIDLRYARVCAYKHNKALAHYENVYAPTVAVTRLHLTNNSIIIFTFFNLFSLSATMIFFSKYLPYSTINGQLTEEPCIGTAKLC